MTRSTLAELDSFHFVVVCNTFDEAGVAVLHYDRDYESIAEVTRQSAEWVVPAGSDD